MDHETCNHCNENFSEDHIHFHLLSCNPSKRQLPPHKSSSPISQANRKTIDSEHPNEFLEQEQIELDKNNYEKPVPKFATQQFLEQSFGYDQPEPYYETMDDHDVTLEHQTNFIMINP